MIVDGRIDRVNERVAVFVERIGIVEALLARVDERVAIVEVLVAAIDARGILVDLLVARGRYGEAGGFPVLEKPRTASKI